MRFDSYFAGYNAYPYSSLYSGMVVVCEKNDRRAIKRYIGMSIIYRKIQVGRHIPIYRYMSRRSFFSQKQVLSIAQ